MPLTADYSALAHEHECAVAALSARLEALEIAIKPLVFSDPLSPPPGVDATDWYEAVAGARKAYRKAEAA